MKQHALLNELRTGPQGKGLHLPRRACLLHNNPWGPLSFGEGVLMAEKRCSKCGVVKNASEFYKCSGSKDGIQRWCKACQLKAVKNYQQSPTGRPKRQAYKRSPAGRAAAARYRRSAAGKAANARYERSPAGRAVRRAINARHHLRHPEERKARNAVNHAIRAGLLTRGPCEVCGAERVQGHHDDYGKPLEPRWLCVRCHGKLRRKEA